MGGVSCWAKGGGLGPQRQRPQRLPLAAAYEAGGRRPPHQRCAGGDGNGRSSHWPVGKTMHQAAGGEVRPPHRAFPYSSGWGNDLIEVTFRATPANFRQCFARNRRSDQISEIIAPLSLRCHDIRWGPGWIFKAPPTPPRRGGLGTGSQATQTPPGGGHSAKAEELENTKNVHFGNFWPMNRLTLPWGG